MKMRMTAFLALGLGSLATCSFAGPVSGQGTWETTLQARDLDGNAANGPEAFYDTDLNITWLRAGGTVDMSWAANKLWAEQSHFGLSGWRLPTTVVTSPDGRCDYASSGTSCGYNPDSSVATGSEMAHLFFQSLGNKSYVAPSTGASMQDGWGLTNTGNFQNLRDGSYWSGTEYFAPNSGSAWFFQTGYGNQYYGNTDYAFYALAVRPCGTPWRCGDRSA